MSQRRPPRDPAEDEELSQALEALSYPVRLALLRDLQKPRILKEIKVKPSQNQTENPDRAISRQAIRHHLDDLLATNVVQSRETQRDFGRSTEYVVNNQVLFSIAERLREYAQLRPDREPEQETIVAEDSQSPRSLEGPCLVVVKGLDEGAVFDLDPEKSDRNEWVIGRRRDNEVPLDFDPFVSSENTVIRWRDGAHVVEDIETSRNGTRVNFDPLPAGETETLATGDLIGVGRCLLMYKT